MFNFFASNLHRLWSFTSTQRRMLYVRRCSRQMKTSYLVTTGARIWLQSLWSRGWSSVLQRYGWIINIFTYNNAAQKSPWMDMLWMIFKEPLTVKSKLCNKTSSPLIPVFRVFHSNPNNQHFRVRNTDSLVSFECLAKSQGEEIPPYQSYFPAVSAHQWCTEMCGCF